MSDKKGIAIAGSIIVDKLNEISKFPAEGELTKILSVSLAVGGCVPNTGIDIKKVAPDINVKAVGIVGKDAEGDFAVESLVKNGVDSSFVKRGNLPTSFTEVMSVIGSQRTFFAYPGACADFGYEDIDFENLDVKMLHLGYFLLLEKIDNGDGKRILKKAQEMGIKTSIDMVSENSDRYSLVEDCLKYTDNVIINEHEAGMLTGIEPKPENLEEIAKKIKEMGVKERVIIHMPEIGICLSDNGYFELPSPSLPDGFIKGKTGAGDAFCAGALIGIYREMDEESILALATKTAAISLSSFDATGGAVSESEIDKILSEINVKI